MSSVEGNEEVEAEFNKILKEEFKQEWHLIDVSPKIATLMCYLLPCLLMTAWSDYHHHNLFATLIFALIIGAGLHGYYRHQVVVKAFFSSDRPVGEVIREIRDREARERQAEQPVVAVQEEEDWDEIVARLEVSMDNIDDNGNSNSDKMNLATLFDRGDSAPRLAKKSWFGRIFKRN